ncbi:hypothetical protein CAL26_21090 [Bordetella genomosp. 9]|uniref:Uncharacterized protein n=1 Tax=Bordetella genomosp. 9 TaxID=1416803 RepID=A0A261R5Y4_9BORD|nr:hypothetical protein [Bordetella genomosp. 9]OZI20052.1 hypothetical protein CAL26_21090 [Bordetella genomosp. 9]
MADPLGVRLNNPGSIRFGAGFEGEQEGEKGFARFPDPIAGGKALVKNLMTYGSKYGLNTVEGIITRYAPPNENNTKAYIAAVSGGLGVEPNAPLDMRSPEVLSSLARQIANHEQGREYDPEFFKGVAQSVATGQPADPLTRVFMDSASQPTYSKEKARAEGVAQYSQVPLDSASQPSALDAEFNKAAEALPGLYDDDAARLANEQLHAGFQESVLDSMVHGTVTGKLFEIAQRGDFDPSFDAASEDNRKRMQDAGVYGNDQLADYVLGSRNADDFAQRLQTAQERLEYMRRMANTQGLDKAGAVAGQLIGGFADPVAVISTMGMGAAVASARSAAAAGRALSIARGAGAAAVENIAIGQALEAADNQRFSWGELVGQGITGAALGTLGGLLVRHDGRLHTDLAEQAKPEAIPVLDAAARAAQGAVDGTTGRAWIEGQLRDAGLGADTLDHSISTDLGGLDGAALGLSPRVKVDPLAERQAYVLDKQIEALEAQRAGLTPATAELADPGAISKARGDIQALRQGMPTADDEKALTRMYQDQGMKYREANQRARKELADKQADVEAQVARLEDTVRRNAEAQQATERVQQVDQQLEQLRKQREGVAAPKTARTVLSQVLDAAYAAQRERATFTPLPRPRAELPAGARASTVKGELSRLAREAQDPLIRTLAGRLREQRFPDSVMGYWSPEDIRRHTNGKGLAYYDPVSGTVNVAHGAPEHIVLHEISHAATLDAIALGKQHPTSTVGKLTAELDTLRTQMQKAHADAGGGTQYYLNSVEEFVAGLYSGDSEFVRRLSATKLDTGESLLSRAVQLVRTLLGLGPQDNNAFLKALDLSDRLIEAPLPGQSGNTGLHLFPADEKIPLTVREQQLKDALEAVGEDLSPEARETAERAQKWLDSRPEWLKKGDEWAASPGVVLSRSKSKVARIAGSILFENSMGSGKRPGQGTVALNYEMMQRGYRDSYLMDIQKDMVSLMSPKERADYAMLGGARQAVERISDQVAEERLRRRAAIKEGREHVSTAPAEVQRIAAAMDSQIAKMVRDGEAVGNEYAENVKGSGIVGFMPQVWKWDRFGDALRSDPKTWEALRKNFTQQYVEMNVEPVIKEMLASGADPEQLARARARLMEQVEHQVNTRLTESVRDPDTRTNMDEGKFENMAAELLDENFHGAQLTDDVVSKFRQLLGDRVRDRTRTEFDLLREVDGVRLLDFVEHDMVSTVQHTAHRFAGQNAMAKAGFKDYQDFEALLTLATKDGATPEDVKLLQFAGRAFGFQPMKASDHPILAALKNFTYAATMGKLGIANLGDLANVTTAAGFRGMFKTLGYGFRGETELYKSLANRAAGLLGQDYRIHAMTADVLPNGRAMTGMGQRLLRVSQKSAQLVSWLNGSNFVQKMLHKGFLPVLAEDLTNAIRGKEGGMSVRRLADAGIDGETAQRIRGQLEKYEAARKEGDAFRWDEWDDQQAADKFIEAMHRVTYQTFQRSLIGEAAMWRSESPLGAVIGQFHNFGLTSMEKQLGRNLAINDMNTYTALAVGMSWAALLYYARLQVNTMGMDKSQAEQYVKDNTTPWKLAQGTLTYFNMSGVAAEMFGVGEVVFGGNTYQAGSGPVAAMGYFGSLSKAANSAGSLLTGQSSNHRKDARNILRILPGGNSIAGTYYSNLLRDED